MPMRVLALMCTVLVAVLWASPPGIAFLCSMDGQRHASCCCVGDGEHADAEDGRIERAECCEVERDATGGSAACTPAGVERDGAMVLAFAVSDREPGLGAASVDRVLPLARGPPRAQGPPTFLRHCRFLI